jgi:L-malate glycosyltransferase
MTSDARLGRRSPMRVCHFASGDLWAGAEVQLVTLLGALGRFSELELSALLLNGGRLADEIASKGIPVTICEESQLGPAKLFLNVTNYLKKLQPDIVHSHRYKEHIIGALAGKLSHNPVTVQTYHGLQENLPGWGGLKMSFYNAINVAVAKLTANGIVGVSEQITNVLEARYPGADVRCIRNGIDLTQIVSDVQRLETRAQWNISPQTFVVGTVGRLVPIKGFEYLIEAFARFRRQSAPRESKLMLVGDGPLRVMLEQCADRHDVSRDVQFLGTRTDVYDVMRAFDVFVLPSLHEGVPMVLLEAMALGVPIVASSVGGIPEVLEDRREAILVPSKDVEGLARALAAVAGSVELCSTQTRLARERVENQFSIHTTAASMRDMYHTLCATARRRS